jgi:hypothetical protein
VNERSRQPTAGSVDEVVYISRLEVPQENEADFMQLWDRGMAYLGGQHGFASAALYQQVNGEPTLHFTATVSWRSQEEFDMAASRLGFDSPSFPYPYQGALYRRVR